MRPDGSSPPGTRTSPPEADAPREPGALPIEHHLRGPRLVGRREQLQAMGAELGHVFAGSFRIMLVTGAPGVGKSRLAAELTADHATRATCLWARAHRWGTASSFGLWVEALDRNLRTRDPDEVRDLCGTSSGDLAAILKPVEAVAPRLPEEPQRARILEGLVDLFDRMSAGGPVLVALDDVHLADDSSWEALRYLGRRLTAAPIGVVATARPGELARNAAALDVLAGLDDDGLLRREVLPPLSRSEIADLAHEVLRTEPDRASTFIPAPFVDWITERSLGHPLFVVDLVRAAAHEDADLAEPQLGILPDTLRERIELDLRRLGDDERGLLELLAVVAQRTDLRDVVELTGWSDDRIDRAIETLRAAWLVVDHGHGADLVFEIAHPIIQDTIYEGIGHARRRALHRSLARLLAASGRLGAAGPHFARSADRGDTEAIDALCRAMRQAEDRGLYQEALRTMAALVEMLPAGDQRWRQVLDSMRWQSEWVLSHLAESDAGVAIEAMHRIDQLLDDEDAPSERATVQLHLAAFLSFGAGRLEEAERACRRAIELFDREGGGEPGMLAENELAWIEGCRGDLAAHAARATRTSEAAIEAGFDRAAVQASGSAAYALGLLGRAEADEAFALSIELAARAGNTYRVAWGNAQWGVTLSLAGRLDDAERAVDRAFDLGPLAADALVHEDLAHCRWLRGDLPSVVAQVDQSVVRRPIRGSRRRAWALALAARAHIEMDDPARATIALEQAEATYDGRHIMAWSPWCDWTRGLVAWHGDDVEGALDALDAAATRFGDMGAAAYAALVLVDRAEVASDAGDGERAAQSAVRLQDHAARCAPAVGRGLAALGTAWSELAAGRLDPALEAAASAARACEEIGFGLHHTRALEIRGRALGFVDRSAAIEVLTDVTARCDDHVARWRRSRVATVLRRMGTRGRRSVAALDGPEALTDREREVVELAARGFTAREIGERLFIGTRTVESHLSSSYAKLGVGSKREIVRRAHQLGLDPSPDP